MRPHMPPSRIVFVLSTALTRSIARIGAVAILVAAAPAANAIAEWASWGSLSGNTIVGSLSGGRTVVMTAAISQANPAGVIYAADPTVPGQPGGGNPTYVLARTAVGHPTTVPDGALIASLDLSGVPITPETVFGLADMSRASRYRLELLDSANNVLSLAGVLLQSFNLTYPNTTLADLDVLLDPSTGNLTVSPVHDAADGSSYSHSGLTLFSDLPSDATTLRMVANGLQGSEGIQLYFGAVPEPTSLVLLPVGAFALVSRRIPKRR